jgi:predicted nucleotidyltransferase
MGMFDIKTLWVTNIGSHAWLMNRPDSDIDLFTAYIIPSRDLLSGKNHGYGSHCSGGSGAGEIDKVSHEIGKIVDELIKGNINFLVGTLSPLILSQHKDCLISLRNIVVEYGQTKACTHSIRGLAFHNYRKYVIGSDTAREYPLTKKCNTINRVLLFGINLLNGNGFEFKPVQNQTPDDVKNLLGEFDKTVLTSKIPETTDPDPFRAYLFDLRMRELTGTL